MHFETCPSLHFEHHNFSASYCYYLLSTVTHAHFHASVLRPASQVGPMHEVEQKPSALSIMYSSRLVMWLYDAGIEQLLVPLTERLVSDFALTVTAVNSTLKDSIEQLVTAKVCWCCWVIQKIQAWGSPCYIWTLEMEILWCLGSQHVCDYSY